MDNVRLTHLRLLKYCELYPGPKMQYFNTKAHVLKVENLFSVVVLQRLITQPISTGARDKII